ncbi:GNAT family N-acetyltransferase [Chitiniphilus purpureus]|uniref:GNAT family N-acetyltransferase n=1 Tax=Chitiniphilus purpureus TaxID=2981137 RepID=A0ABY6DR84_9NEIS|nr:GNAT family N-acetyltransferase [Chitiniphilus sp. CD1]UXY16890.1 GNAT family N-acetyltransferase [Chitiniphilus sp. CD1]
MRSSSAWLGWCGAARLDPFITDIAVRPDLKGQGIGRAMMQVLLDDPALRHAPRWQASVAADNPAALAFFLRLGWQRAAQPDEEGMIDHCFVRPA